MSKQIHSKYYASVGGFDKEKEVTLIESDGAMFKIDVDGKIYDVDCVRTGNSLFSIIVNHRSYEIDIFGQNTSFDVLVDGDYFKVEVLDELKKAIRDKISKGVQGKQVITTPMPGLVTKVLVKPGQEVKAGDALIILVAMKMENQIKSPKDGIVADIFIEANKTVSAGDKLIVID